MRKNNTIYRLCCTYCLSLIDLIFTLQYVQKYGLEIEGNPVGRWILSDGWRTFMIKMIFVLAGLYLIWRYRELKIARVASWIVMIAYSFLSIYHIIILIALR